MCMYTCVAMSVCISLYMCMCLIHAVYVTYKHVLLVKMFRRFKKYLSEKFSFASHFPHQFTPSFIGNH